MTTFKPGDILLAMLVFTDGSATKKRPVLGMSGEKYNQARDEIVVTAISSNTTRKLFGEIRIKAWKKAGLLYPSIMTGIFFTIRKEFVEKRIGCLQAEDWTGMKKVTEQVLEPAAPAKKKRRVTKKDD